MPSYILSPAAEYISSFCQFPTPSILHMQWLPFGPPTELLKLIRKSQALACTTRLTPVSANENIPWSNVGHVLCYRPGSSLASCLANLLCCSQIPCYSLTCGDLMNNYHETLLTKPRIPGTRWLRSLPQGRLPVICPGLC